MEGGFEQCRSELAVTEFEGQLADIAAELRSQNNQLLLALFDHGEGTQSGNVRSRSEAVLR
ncbi:hypothetical protein GCM10025762_11850 [Haloechinothrix salitolerans]